jgi:sulfur-oxidizing protein SoxZ
MAPSPARIRVPKVAGKGEIVEIRTLFRHAMETGRRKDEDGNTVPRRIINRFEARLNGKPVFTAELHPAVAANPYLSFFVRVEEPGALELTWSDDDGSIHREKALLEIA